MVCGRVSECRRLLPPSCFRDGGRGGVWRRPNLHKLVRIATYAVCAYLFYGREPDLPDANPALSLNLAYLCHHDLLVSCTGNGYHVFVVSSFAVTVDANPVTALAGYGDYELGRVGTLSAVLFNGAPAGNHNARRGACVGY